MRLEDGLKQGSPLSPLLFIVSVDPLLTEIHRVRTVEPWCFADDLAIGFTQWSSLAPCCTLIDAWSKVAGCMVNLKKTKIITTVSAVDRPPLDSFMPVGWAGVDFADSYVYLGILIGRSVDVISVFEAALEKFRDRIETSMVTNLKHSTPCQVE